MANSEGCNSSGGVNLARGRHSSTLKSWVEKRITSKAGISFRRFSTVSRRNCQVSQIVSQIVLLYGYRSEKQHLRSNSHGRHLKVARATPLCKPMLT